MTQASLLQKKRLEYQPILPDLLKDLHQVVFKKISSHKLPLESLRFQFPKTFEQKPFLLKKEESLHSSPLTIGVLFSGGQAAGGHNVIAALFDALKIIHPDSRLIGFLGGIGGVLKDQKKELLAEEIACFRNQGGFDLIGTGRDKIETPEHLQSALATSLKEALDGLIIIGGDDSNTNAAVLAEYFLAHGCETRVVGIPKTIDGDLQSEDIEISFGFDTACKTYSEIIGNIARDALAAKKYYHFIKLMGRSASHICLECALSVHPNMALIGEERKSLEVITKEIADLICARSEKGKEYGIILIPEGLIEFMPEMEALIAQLNSAVQKSAPSVESIQKILMEPERKLFLSLPEKIQQQLLFDRDPHGNVRVSQIDTEQLLMFKVTQELKKRASYKGKFTAQEHFLGYEGRSAFPSNFDANYCYALGLTAALAVRDGLTGVICALQKLSHRAEHWQAKAVPILYLMDFEMRKGEKKAVIHKTLVDMNRPSFVQFSRSRKSWETEDHYCYPGPIQFFGDRSLTDSVPFALNK